MIKLKCNWKKVVTSVFAVLGVGTLTSCYGVIDPSSVPGVAGTVTSAKTTEENEGTPIEGIKITMQTPDGTVLGTTTTESDGSYYFELSTEGYSDSGKQYTLIFEDVDGKANGSFKKKIDTVTIDLYQTVLKNVELEEAE